MKNLLSAVTLYLISSFVASAAFACPDLSGSFISEESKNVYSIKQTACDFIEYTFEEGSIEFPTDGKKYLLKEHDVVIGGKLFATISDYFSYSYSGNHLNVTNTTETKYVSGYKRVEVSHGESHLNKDGDLESHYFNASASTRTIDKRVR